MQRMEWNGKTIVVKVKPAPAKLRREEGFLYMAYWRDVNGPCSWPCKRIKRGLYEAI